MKSHKQAFGLRVRDSASEPRAALYMRVSTGRQAEHDLSIPDQRRQLGSWCRGHVATRSSPSSSKLAHLQATIGDLSSSR
jgi:hypothetical protein